MLSLAIVVIMRFFFSLALDRDYYGDDRNGNVWREWWKLLHNDDDVFVIIY